MNDTKCTTELFDIALNGNWNISKHVEFNWNAIASIFFKILCVLKPKKHNQQQRK